MGRLDGDASRPVTVQWNSRYLVVGALFAMACGETTHGAQQDDGSGGGTGIGTTDAGLVGSVGTSGSQVASGSVCDPMRIFGEALEAQESSLDWLIRYLEGDIAVYRGSFLAARTVSGDEQPGSSQLASTDSVATLQLRDRGAWWNDLQWVDGAWLDVKHLETRITGMTFAQPTSSPATTYVEIGPNPEGWRALHSECEDCLADLASIPDVIVAEALVLEQPVGEETDRITLDMELTRVPPEELTGELVFEIAGGPVWTLEAGEWVDSKCERYNAYDDGNTGDGWYRVERFINDADPMQHGIRAITVLDCVENCPPPQNEGDSCPQYPATEACE